MSRQKKKHSAVYNVLSWLVTIVVAIVLASTIKAFAFEFVRVDGDSMQDTLQSGDVVLVTKLDYGTIWLTMPWQSAYERELANRFNVGFGDVKQADVVIVRYPGNGTDNFVKRIVGLPGDVIAVRDGFLYVNGVFVNEPYITDAYRMMDAEWLNELRSLGLQEDMPDGVANFDDIRIPCAGDTVTFGLRGESLESVSLYVNGDVWPWWGISSLMHDSDGNELRVTPYGVFWNGEAIDIYEAQQAAQLLGRSFTLDEDLYFVMGDHRNDSMDSRLFGAISRSCIIGHARQVIFPFSAWKTLE